MAASGASSPGDMRRRHQSPRPKGRENTKNVLCRNITIYGSCRAQNNGCPYNHELPPKPTQQTESAKRFLNVDSPSFKPLSPVTNSVQPAKNLGISPKAASAAVFTPKATAAVPTASAKQPSTEWSQRGIQEFVPQNFVPQATESGSSANNLSSFDPFTMQGNPGQMSDASHTPQINPYAQDASTLAATSMFSAAAAFAHPLSYHLYAPLGPHRENLMAYQRTTHDFFIPDHLREEMQRK
ncbi:PAB-dependent poly(A)-specific ribonuclease subunit pan3, partial [Aureobasidium melanogenum]